MRILLDECLPRRLRSALAGHEVATVQEQGWAGVQNGELLRRAASHDFAAFLTVDRGIQYQQNLGSVGIAVVALHARSNDIVDPLPLMPEVEEVLPTLVPGQFVRVPRTER
ncbi:MAG TPA: DUF5615 family PIN-like protein [Gemmatimonadaceae bacterium]